MLIVRSRFASSKRSIITYTGKRFPDRTEDIADGVFSKLNLCATGPITKEIVQDVELTSVSYSSQIC